MFFMDRRYAYLPNACLGEIGAVNLKEMSRRIFNYIFLLLLLGSLIPNLSIRRNPVKEMFFKSLPDTSYYAREKEVFERYGRKLSSLVLVVPPLKFSRSEVRNLLIYAERVNKTLPFALIWSLNRSHDPQYIEMLASELISHEIPSRVFANISPELLDPLRGVAEVWIREENGWKRIGGPPESHGDGMWRCDEIYHGLVNPEGDVWWFYYDDGRASGCTKGDPPLSACDVHAIFRANFLGMGEGAALITFPGSEPAVNCGESCGSANTLVNGTCSLGIWRPNELMFASYMMTHTRKDPCPYYSYCGCFGSCNSPQKIFISDIRGILRK